MQPFDTVFGEHTEADFWITPPP